MMTKDELEQVYDKEDPWRYKTTLADLQRKSRILHYAMRLARVHGSLFDTALDIGCGEGWITQDLPARLLFGDEESTQAKLRWYPGIIDIRSHPKLEKIDLVLMTGVLYENYDWEGMVDRANSLAHLYIMTCNIADREYRPAISKIKGELMIVHEFEYDRGPGEKFEQRLRIYRV